MLKVRKFYPMNYLYSHHPQKEFLPANDDVQQYLGFRHEVLQGFHLRYTRG